MKLIAQLIIPIVLGVVAATIHFMSYPRATHRYCQCKSDITAQFADTPEKLEQQIQPSEPYLEDISGAIEWKKRKMLLGMPVSRPLKAQGIVFETDLSVSNGIKAGEGRVAVNVSLQDVALEPEFLRVGETIGFVVEELEESTGKTSFRLLKPFKILAVGNVVTESLNTGGEDPPATICIEGASDLADLQELLRSIRDQTIVAIAFDVN
jgi:hypothetical protein